MLPSTKKTRKCSSHTNLSRSSDPIKSNKTQLKLIIREKTNKDITARFALGGDRQPPHTYGDTHAGTSDATHRAFTLAAGQAHAAIHQLDLITFNFDIPAAFLNKNPLPRDKTGNTQFFLALLPTSHHNTTTKHVRSSVLIMV